MQRGFVPVPDGENGIRIQSVNGDLTVDTRDGIRYTIRFGDVRDAEAAADLKLDRYMMVTTSVNEAMFPMPEMGAVQDSPAPAGDAPAPNDAPTPDASAEQDNAADSGDDEQRRAEAAYRRAVEERKSRLAAAQRRVDELNQRFGDWYYVVSEASYRAVRLDRSELIMTR